MKSKILTPAEACDALESLHKAATEALKTSLHKYLRDRIPPDKAMRRNFVYPELRLTYTGQDVMPRMSRAYAKLQGPGTYATTITSPVHFRPYLMEQLTLLTRDYDCELKVGPSSQEIPYPYVLELSSDLGMGDVTSAELALHFPVPLLATVGDEIADGTWDMDAHPAMPLALFDAVRVDYSLRRLVHYTGTDWRAIQPWILLTNYHRYIDQFVQWSLVQLKSDTPYTALTMPGGKVITRDTTDADARKLVEDAPWHRYQMPAYSLARSDKQGGVTLVNIGVGPSNAKTMTDHLAVLRPDCWLMIGHCGGLRQSQRIGDYVLAHAYLRQDRILDSLVPPDIPIPALAEIQVALQQAAADVTGETGEALKARLRTGTVVTNDDRNWELRYSQERKRINLSRAIGVDMESGTLAAQGYRLRVPYGTLLCVSDKPLHGEIKLPGAANAFYDRAVSEHLLIGLAALDRLRNDRGNLHSRKLRSFDEPPFR
jgi:AMP nucleosidase